MGATVTLDGQGAPRRLRRTSEREYGRGVVQTICALALLLATAAAGDERGQGGCRRGIIFVKTHKTASSTLAALLRANTWASNQTMFLPPPGALASRLRIAVCAIAF